MNSDNNEIYTLGIIQCFTIGDILHYFGKLDDIYEFINYCREEDPHDAKIWYDAYLEYLNGNQKASYKYLGVYNQLITPCRVHFKKTFKGKDLRWKHISKWRQSLFFKAEEYNNEHMWIEADGIYYRCVKPVFTDFYCSYEYDYSNIREVNYVEDNFLLTEFIQNDKRTITSRLFIFEKSFGSSYEKMNADYKKFEEKYSEYTTLCDIIYGDNII